MSTTQTQRPIDASASTSQAVVAALADHKGVEPVELTPPLYEVVDPDALDSLFDPATRDADGRIEFLYEDCRVAVDPVSGVVVTEDVDA